MSHAGPLVQQRNTASRSTRSNNCASSASRRPTRPAPTARGSALPGVVRQGRWWNVGFAPTPSTNARAAQGQPWWEVHPRGRDPRSSRMTAMNSMMRFDELILLWKILGTNWWPPAPEQRKWTQGTKGLFPTPILVLAHAISEHWEAPLTSPVMQEHLRVAEAAVKDLGTTNIMCTQSIENFGLRSGTGTSKRLSALPPNISMPSTGFSCNTETPSLDPGTPWSGLIRAYLRRPDDIVPNTRNRRILPSRLAMSTTKAASPICFTAAHVSPDGRGVLPLFGTDTAPPVAWPLELYRMGGGTDAQKGRGISMPLRIFTEAVLFVKPQTEMVAPKPLTTRSGSCWLYFIPMDLQVPVYTGPAWYGLRRCWMPPKFQCSTRSPGDTVCVESYQ